MPNEIAWDHHSALLLRRAERLIRDPRVALWCSPEDLVQETLLKVTARGQAFRGQSEPEQIAYVLRIQEKLAIDLHRKHLDAECRSVGKEVRENAFRGFNDALDESAAGLGAILPADQTTVGQRAAKNEMDERLTAAIAELPERERIAITLKREGLPLSEICAAMGETADAVGSVLYRAMARLRNSLPPDA